MFSVKEIIGDVRASVINLLIMGFLLVLASVGGAIWQSVRTQPIPWALLLAIGVCGIVLLGIAVVKLRMCRHHARAVANVRILQDLRRRVWIEECARRRHNPSPAGPC